MLAGKEYFCLYLMGQRKPLSNIENVCTALESDPELIGKFLYNELCNTVMMRCGNDLKEITDPDITDVQRYLQRNCALPGVTEKIAIQGISRQAHLNSYNPVRDYLKVVEKKWDGDYRNDEWLTHALGVVNNRYSREAGEISLLQAVARVFDPGCKADYILVLVGSQGMGKSTACRTLFDPWFTDVLPDITSKDGSMALSGVWGIEIAEMAAFLKTEGYHSKAFTTRQEERYRLPYGRTVQKFGRQCVLFGTSNERRFNADPTGGRRFFGVDCGREGSSNLDWLKANRDQIWGEAVNRYKTGAPRHPSPEIEAEFFHPEQQASQEYDELTDAVLDYAERQAMPFTITAMWRDKFARFDPIPSPIGRRIAAILRRNGYEDFQVKGRVNWRKV